MDQDEARQFNLEEVLAKNKLNIGLGLLGIFLLGVGILSAKIFSSQKESSSVEILPSQEENEQTEIFVHVAGAVRKPGLYKLSSLARVNDALINAGGLSEEADREWFNKNINLAQKLPDGIKLYIPFKAEVKKGKVNGSQAAFPENSGKVNLNTCSISELESLSGIGPSFAQKIIDYRQTYGPFSKIEDLIKVGGIGQKTFDNIKDKITVF